MDWMSERDREGEKIRGNWRRKGSKRAIVRGGEQKEGREKEAERQEEKEQEGKREQSHENEGKTQEMGKAWSPTPCSRAARTQGRAPEES